MVEFGAGRCFWRMPSIERIGDTHGTFALFVGRVRGGGHFIRRFFRQPNFGTAGRQRAHAANRRRRSGRRGRLSQPPIPRHRRGRHRPLLPHRARAGLGDRMGFRSRRAVFRRRGAISECMCRCAPTFAPPKPPATASIPPCRSPFKAARSPGFWLSDSACSVAPATMSFSAITGWNLWNRATALLRIL